MAVSDVCSTNEAVRAFIENLLDPMLPAKPFRDYPTPTVDQKVAKQIHSIVLLYNYYLRKQHPELAFVAFKEFCKLAVDLRPTLSAHMKFMQKPDTTELVDVEQQLSLTEKTIMSACDMCKGLDAEENVPNIEGWPISKVAVLLVDSKKENCFLCFSSTTEGVWSVIEKDVDTSSQSSEVTSGTENTHKKKRVIKKPIKNVLNVQEDENLQVGYSAIKEAVGVNRIDIMLLESYTVYSHSKEKTASRFYIMKCLQSVNQGLIQVPIKDLIESLRGPFLRRSCSSWMTTPVVDYFHVLPYSKIISGWISRETLPNSLQNSKLTEKNRMVNSPEVQESYVNSEGVSIGLQNKPSRDTIEAPNKKESNGFCTITWSGSPQVVRYMDVDTSSVFPSENREECQHIDNTLPVSEDQEIEKPSVQHNSNGSTISLKAEKLQSTRMAISEGGIKDQSVFDKIYANTTSINDAIEERTVIANNSSTDLEKIGVIIASKGKMLSQTALGALIRKRDALALQLRMIEDEIVMCDKKIQRLSTGAQDDLDLKIQSIIEGCNDTRVRSQGRMSQHVEDQGISLVFKRRRLAEAVLSLQSPCQELDDICYKNNWILPTYHLSLSDGGIEASVTVKGGDFEQSCGGKPCSFPLEARESAAVQMLTNLRSMAKSAQ